MAGLRVYYDLMSQPARAVYMFLKVTGVPFTENPVALRTGEHLSDEYGKVNPLHLVPVIDDNGFILTESISILKYLHTTRDLPDHWYPRNPQKRARVDEYLSWYHLNTRIKSAMVFRAKVIEPRARNSPVDEERLRKFSTELDTSMYQLETIFLKDRNYLAGDDISIADIMAICEVMAPYASGYDILEGRPKVSAWVERVQQRLSPHFDNIHINGPLGRLFSRFNPTCKMYVNAKL